MTSFPVYCKEALWLQGLDHLSDPVWSLDRLKKCVGVEGWGGGLSPGGEDYR